MFSTIRSILVAISLVSLVGCGAEPADEMPEVGGAAGHVETGGAAGANGTGGAAGAVGAAGAAGAVGTGGTAAGKGGAAGAASTGGAVGTGGGVASTGGAGGKGGSTPGTGGAAVEPPVCGYVGQYSECTRRSAPGSRLQLGLKGGRTCALCDGRSVTECTLITPDSTDDDVACVTECTECTDWL